MSSAATLNQVKLCVSQLRERGTHVRVFGIRSPSALSGQFEIASEPFTPMISRVSRSRPAVTETRMARSPSAISSFSVALESSLSRSRIQAPNSKSYSAG